jgi:hypothetical protein
MTLHPCFWNRVECSRCGNYDVADDQRWDGQVVCPKCKGFALVTMVLIGQTSRELPYVGNVAPKFDVGGMPMPMESIERGRKLGARAHRA